MSTTATYSDLHVRLNADVKRKAELILDDLGIAPSGAVSMFYRQIIAHDGLPFQVVRRPNPVPDMDSLSQEEINARLYQAQSDIAIGSFRPAEDVFRDILGDRYAKI